MFLCRVFPVALSAAPVNLHSQPFWPAPASASVSEVPPTSAPNDAKNSPASFFSPSNSIKPATKLGQLAADLVRQPRNAGS